MVRGAPPGLVPDYAVGIGGGGGGARKAAVPPAGPRYVELPNADTRSCTWTIGGGSGHPTDGGGEGAHAPRTGNDRGPTRPGRRPIIDREPCGSRRERDRLESRIRALTQ